ncbi:MAG: GntR family transcriptional regulator [Saccharofermentans sp.]|nr:GntR family transcriptional regulator [Saccharofermentans sp.]
MSKYKEIISILDREIKQMREDGKTRLPTESELCARFNVSRDTIRTALKHLEQKGLIVKRRGSGSFIAGGIKEDNNKILFVTHDEDKYIYPGLIADIRSVLDQKGYELVCRSTEGSYKEEGKILSEVTEGFAALIIEPISDVFPNPNMPLIQKIQDSNIPIVYLYSRYPTIGDSVLISEDDMDGAMILMHHLLEKGHRRVAGIFRMDQSHGLAKYKGCINAFRKLGIEFDQDSFLLASNAKGCKESRALRGFIEQKLPGNTAVVCQNDILAYLLIEELTKMGKKVPQDIAVVSFDNSYYSHIGKIGITSLGHEDKAMGTALAKAAIYGKANPDKMPWQLFERESS